MPSQAWKQVIKLQNESPGQAQCIISLYHKGKSDSLLQPTSLCFKMENIVLNKPGKLELKKAEFLAVVKAHKAIIWSSPGFEERTHDSSGFSSKGAGILIQHV